MRCGEMPPARAAVNRAQDAYDKGARISSNSIGSFFNAYTPHCVDIDEFMWSHPDFLIPATNEIVQEFADLLAVVAQAAADNRISPAESRKIRARWEELKSVTETFVHCCEQGNFQPIKEATKQT